MSIEKGQLSAVPEPSGCTICTPVYLEGAMLSKVPVIKDKKVEKRN